MASRSYQGALLGLILASAGVGGAQAAALEVSASLDTHAIYQGDDSGIVHGVHGDPGNAQVEATAGPGDDVGTLGPDVTVYDGALARARSQLDSALSTSSVGTYAHAGGFSPGFASPPDQVTANASVRWVLRFVVNAPVEITTAQLNAELSVDGMLLAAAFGGARVADDVWASVGATATTRSSLGTVTWIDASATLDWLGNLAETGPWAGHFNYVPPPLFGRDQVATIAYHQNLPNLITVPTNEIFEYVVEMRSEAFVKGAFENWALSDFYNTAAFDLSVSTPGLSLERLPAPAVVPLPAPVALLAGAIVLLAGRRRRTTA